MQFEPTKQEITVAKQTAWQVGKRWSSVEIEDLRQHLLLWILEHPAQVERFRAQDSSGSLAVSLRREALRYCTKETAARQGRPLERDRFYSEEVVRRALPFLFQEWPETNVRTDPQTGRSVDRPFNSGDALAIMSDIKSAFNKLPPQNQLVLELRFQEDLTLDDVGKRLELSHQAIEQTVNKSITFMSEVLSR